MFNRSDQKSVTSNKSNHAGEMNNFNMKSFIAQINTRWHSISSLVGNDDAQYEEGSLAHTKQRTEDHTQTAIGDYLYETFGPSRIKKSLITTIEMYFKNIQNYLWRISQVL